MPPAAPVMKTWYPSNPRKDILVDGVKEGGVGVPNIQSAEMTDVSSTEQAIAKYS